MLIAEGEPVPQCCVQVFISLHISTEVNILREQKSDTVSISEHIFRFGLKG